MAKMLDTDSELVRRGRFLELGNFITHFQSHLLPEAIGAQPHEFRDRFVVSPSDIHYAFEYRDLLKKREILKDRYFIAEETGRVQPILLTFSHFQKQTLAEELRSIEEEMEKLPTQSKHVHDLLQRFEVWSSKIVAQQTFVTPTTKGLVDDHSTVTQCCFSPFLNLPSSAYFYDLLPEVSREAPPIKEMPSAFHSHSVPCCTLLLSPNKHTWKEFARISKMMEVLDKDSLKKVYKSPCLSFEIPKSPKKSPKHNQSYNQTFEFKSYDLVPLWVRAQRNTQAMRHLCLLYEINKFTERHGNSPEIITYKAILRGNPPNYPKYRIVDMSPLVDQLIEWAVTNQSIFTYRHVKFHIQRSLGQQSNKRSASEDLYKKPRKKLRHETSKSSENDMHALSHACRSYILRWFARRNRKATAVLFTSKQEYLALDIGTTEQDRSRVNVLCQSTDHGIRKYLKGKDIANLTAYEDDRTFARIDRRLEIRQRFDGKISLSSSVQSLLDALAECTTPSQLERSLIDTAKSDFQIMCDRFFTTSADAYETSLKLLGSSSDSDEIIAKKLLDAPPPWKDFCSVCLGRRPFETCACCERVFHEACMKNCKRVSLNDIINSYKPLRALCRLKVPSDVPQPDFRNQDEAEWSTQDVIIERPIDETGKAMRLGLSLAQSEDCLESYTFLNSGHGLVSDLARMIARDKENLRKSSPIALECKGSLIIDVHRGNFCGLRAGLRPGDVIVSLQVLEFTTLDDAKKYGHGKVFDFQDLSKSQRLELLQLQTKKLKVKVIRPKKDILGISHAWYNRIIHLNKARSECLLDRRFNDGYHSHLKFCEDCLDAKWSEQSKECLTTLQEAQNCRAVIRRIGMESYAQPFITEMIEDRTGKENGDGAGSSTDVVSFRRLDAMMTSIIDQESPAGNNQSFTRAFVVPPWAGSNRTSKRLSWVPEGAEKSPMNLLCDAVDFLLDSCKTDVSTQKALFRHFLFAFSSWCVLASKKSSNCHSTSGPPGIFKSICPPWLASSCKVCIGRASTNKNRSLCDSPLCHAMTACTISKDEGKRVAESMDEYTERASLVGTTLLVMPSDPLVSAVSKIVEVDHSDRPVEFIVASYLPPEFGRQVLHDRPIDKIDNFVSGDGIFHLLPVVQTNQMTYLLQRCGLRKKGRKQDSGADLDWSSLDVLNLPGVARLSFVELNKKLLESTAIRNAIDAAISRAHYDSTMNDTNVFDSRAAMNNDTTTRVISSTSTPTSSGILQCHLIDSLLYGSGSPVLINELLQEGSRDIELSNIDSPKKRKILPQSADDRCAYEFGNACLQVGLDCYNAIADTALDVLEPETNYFLFYSDLYFKTGKQRQALEEMLQSRSIPEPSQQYGYVRKIIMLARSSMINDECGSDSEYEPDQENDMNRKAPLKRYKGIGWGFEVVCWKTENVLRIGRVCQNSPAWNAGLRTNDILCSVGGKRVNRFDGIVALATTLLGATSCRIRKDTDSIPEALAVIIASNVKLHSVVLTINRPYDMQVSGSKGHSSNKAAISALPRPTSPRNERTMISQDQAREPLNIFQHTSFEIRTNQNRGVGLTSRYEQRQQIQDGPLMNDWSVANSHNLHTTGNMPYLINAIRSTYIQRRDITQNELHFPVKNNVVFTIGEASLFIECLYRKQPKLGMRLLCPRYSPNKIYEDLQKMFFWTNETLMTIPKIPQRVWSSIMVRDFQRATNPLKPENGDVVFEEGHFKYRLPVDVLPIDNCIQSELQKELLEERAQIQAVRQARYYQGNHPILDEYIQDSYPLSIPGNQSHQRQNGIDNHHHQGEQPDLVHVAGDLLRGDNNNDLPGDRLRGGGDEDDDDRSEEEDDNDDVPGMICLANVPFEKWNALLDVPVCARVYSEGGEESMIVGLAKPSSKLKEEFIGLEIYYHNGRGYFEQSILRDIPSDDVFLVPEQDQNHGGEFCEEACTVLYKLRRRNKSFSSTAKSVKDSSRIIRGLLQKDYSLAFLQSMSQHMNCLGELPDGRNLLWISNDPSALYISQSPLSERVEIMLQSQYQEILSFSSLQLSKYSGRYYCPWGCSIEPKEQAGQACSRESMCFRTIEELHEHYAGFHSFGEKSDKTDLGLSETLLRVKGGKAIVDLCRDLSSAVCVRAPSLVEDAAQSDLTVTTTSSGLKFSKSPTGQGLFLIQKDGLVRKMLESQAKSKITAVANLFYLWDSVFQLFDVEGTGLFRFTHDELLQTTFHKEGASPDSKSSDENLAIDTCTKCKIGCSLCSLPWEKGVGWSDPHKQKSASCGVGCALISNTITSRASSETKDTPGLLGEAKDLLLQLALFIPESLKLSELPISDDPLAGFRLWDQNHYDIWKSFVMDISSPSMLAQAYVTMLASINKTRLPSWWKSDRSGWSTAQVVLARPSLSSLYLHIYVLDAAVAEFLCSACEDNQLSKEKVKSVPAKSIKNKILTIYKRAETLGFPKFEGVHGDVCYICQDGGTLLCCEFCSQTMHPSCNAPPIPDDLDLDVWICGGCMIEIGETKV